MLDVLRAAGHYDLLCFCVGVIHTRRFLRPESPAPSVDGEAKLFRRSIPGCYLKPVIVTFRKKHVIWESLSAFEDKDRNTVFLCWDFDVILERSSRRNLKKGEYILTQPKGFRKLRNPCHSKKKIFLFQAQTERRHSKPSWLHPWCRLEVQYLNVRNSVHQFMSKAAWFQGRMLCWKNWIFSLCFHPSTALTVWNDSRSPSLRFYPATLRAARFARSVPLAGNDLFPVTCLCALWCAQCG